MSHGFILKYPYLLGAIAILFLSTSCTPEMMPLFVSTNSAPPPVGTVLFTQTLPSHETFNFVVWSHNGKRIVAATSLGLVWVIDAENGNIVGNYHSKFCTGTPTECWINGVDWSPDDRYIAFGGRDKVVEVWDTKENTIVTSYTMHTDSVLAIAWSPNGKYIASASKDRQVHIWDAKTGRQLFVYNRNKGWVWSVSWSLDSKRIAAGDAYGEIHVFDALDGGNPLIYTGHGLAVYEAHWSPLHGRMIASVSDDTQVHIWDSNTGQIITRYEGHQKPVKTVAWRFDEKMVASGGDDNQVRIWNPITGKDFYIFKKHTGGVFGVSWSPDGSRIASASHDATLIVWQAE